MSERLPTWRIASPCPVSWNEMSGDDRVRHCGRCDKNVYNLSELTRAGAEDLLERTSGQVCTYFYRRADGGVMTSDCREARWRRLRRRASGVVAATAASFLTLWSSAGAPPRGPLYRQLASLAAPPAPIPAPLGGAPMPNPPQPPEQPKPKKPAPQPQPK